MFDTNSRAISTEQEVLLSIRMLWTDIEEGKRNDDFSRALLSQKIHEALTKHNLAPFATRWVEEVRDRFYAKFVRDWKEGSSIETEDGSAKCAPTEPG